MWVLTNVGYVCAVVHEDDRDAVKLSDNRRKRATDRIVVRARFAEHLEALFPGEPVIKLDKADFRYRVVVSRARFRKMVEFEVESMDYASFKGSVDDPRLYRQYVQWWQIGLDAQRAAEGDVDGGV